MNSLQKQLDSMLKPHLQRTIIMSINNKKIKTGKFLLYTFADYHIEITMTINNKIKRSMIPIPFKAENYAEDGLIYFDYRINSLLPSFKLLTPQSKFYNQILEMEFT